MIDGYRQSFILMVANEFDFFTILSKKPMTCKAVAEIAHTNLMATEKILDALVCLYFLTKKHNKYHTSRLYSPFLVKGGSEYIGNLIRRRYHLLPDWLKLMTVVKRGKKKFIPTIEKVLRQQPYLTKEIVLGLHEISAELAAKVAEALELKSARDMLDVGGGSGIYSIMCAKRNRKLSIIVLDLPHVTKISKTIVSKNHKRKQISFISGNFNRKWFKNSKKKFDLILLSHIMHVNSLKTNSYILKQAKELLKPNGRVAIHDFILEEDRTGPGDVPVFDVNMLVSTKEGRVFTLNECLSILKKTGFKKINYHSILDYTKLIIGSAE